MLAPIGLRLSPDKTRVVHIDEGFDFLGFHIRRMRKRGTQKQLRLHPPVHDGHQVDQGQGGDQDAQVNPHHDLDTLIHQPEQIPDGMGELLPARRVQGRIPRYRPLRLEPTRGLDTSQIPGQIRAEQETTPTPLLRSSDGDSPTTASHSPAHPASRDPLPLPRTHHRDPVDPDTGSHRMTADQLAKTRGAPGALKGARRVRRAVRGNPPAVTLAGRCGPTQPGVCVLAEEPSGRSPGAGRGSRRRRRGPWWRSCLSGSRDSMSGRTR